MGLIGKIATKFLTKVAQFWYDLKTGNIFKRKVEISKENKISRRRTSLSADQPFPQKKVGLKDRKVVQGEPFKLHGSVVRAVGSRKVMDREPECIHNLSESQPNLLEEDKEIANPKGDGNSGVGRDVVIEAPLKLNGKGVRVVGSGTVMDKVPGCIHNLSESQLNVLGEYSEIANPAGDGNCGIASTMSALMKLHSKSKVDQNKVNEFIDKALALPDQLEEAQGKLKLFVEKDQHEALSSKGSIKMDFVEKYNNKKGVIFQKKQVEEGAKLFAHLLRQEKPFEHYRDLMNNKTAYNSLTIFLRAMMLKEKLDQLENEKIPEGQNKEDFSMAIYELEQNLRYINSEHVTSFFDRHFGIKVPVIQGTLSFSYRAKIMQYLDIFGIKGTEFSKLVSGEINLENMSTRSEFIKLSKFENLFDQKINAEDKNSLTLAKAIDKAFREGDLEELKYLREVYLALLMSEVSLKEGKDYSLEEVTWEMMPEGPVAMRELNLQFPELNEEVESDVMFILDPGLYIREHFMVLMK